MFTSDYSAQCKKRWPKSLRATLYVTAAQPRFQSFFGGRFISQNWHFGITKRITKHNFLVLQSTNLYFISNEDHTFEKKNVSFLLVTSTLKKCSHSEFYLKWCYPQGAYCCYSSSIHTNNLAFDSLRGMGLLIISQKGTKWTKLLIRKNNFQ